MKKMIYILFLIFFITASAQHKISPYLQDTGKLKVIVFYTTTCPICQKMTSTLNALQAQYKDSGVSVEIVFPSLVETNKTIAKYAKKYKITYACIQDEHYKLVNQYQAKVAPECFLVDQSGKILYSGKIDNWFYEIGKYRQVVTENYLKDAIEAALHAQPIKISRTEPIGCFIEQVPALDK